MCSSRTFLVGAAEGHLRKPQAGRRVGMGRPPFQARASVGCRRALARSLAPSCSLRTPGYPFPLLPSLSQPSGRSSAAAPNQLSRPASCLGHCSTLCLRCSCDSGPRSSSSSSLHSPRPVASDARSLFFPARPLPLTATCAALLFRSLGTTPQRAPSSPLPAQLPFSRSFGRHCSPFARPPIVSESLATLHRSCPVGRNPTKFQAFGKRRLPTHRTGSCSCILPTTHANHQPPRRDCHCRARAESIRH